MAEGFKIAEGYVEVETRVDGDQIVKDVHRAVDRAEPKISRTSGASIGNSLVRGAGERLRDSRGRFVSDLDEGVKRSLPKTRETGRRRLGSSILSGIGDAFSKARELAPKLGKGLLSASKMPVVVAALGAVGTLLGGGVASALTVALGVGTAGAFLGIGALALKENKKVKKAFEDTGKSIKKTLAEAAKPLVGPFVQGLKDVRGIVRSLKPDLKGIFTELGPQVRNLTTGLGGLLRNTLSGIRDAMPGINAAFSGFASALPRLGTALGNFFRDVFRYPELIKRLSTGMVNFASGTISFLGRAIQGLTVIWGAFTNGIRLWRMGWSQMAAMIDGGSGMFARLGAAFRPLRSAISSAWKALVDFASETNRSQLPARFRTLVQRVKAVWGPLKGFLGQVWDEAWAFVKRVWNTKVKPWIEGTALPWLRSKVQFAMSAVFRDMVSRATGYLKSLPGKARSALSSLPGAVSSILASAASAARSKAASLVSGFIGQVRTLPGRARSAVGAVRSAVVGAVAGAGGWLVGAGRAVISGFISGIRSGAGAVASAVAGIARNAISAAKNALKSRSPSKVFIRIGSDVMSGWLSGLKTGAPGLVAYMKRFADRLGDIRVSKNKRNAIKDLVYEYTKDLTSLNKKLTSVREKLAAQVASYKDLVQAAKDYASSIRENTVGSILGISAPEGQSLTAGTVVSSLKDRVSATTDFLANLKALKGAGLNKTYLQQLLDAGVDQGGEMAKALVGDLSQVSVINDLQGQLSSLGKSLGKFGVKEFHQTGIDVAKGLIKGLESKEAGLERAVARLADRLVKAIKKKLGIKSPSTVAAQQVGAPIADGIGQGVLGRIKAVSGQVADATRAMLPQGVQGVRAGASSVSTRSVTLGGVAVHVHAAPGMDVKALGREAVAQLYTMLDRYERGYA